MSRIKILGVKIDNLDKEAILKRVEGFLSPGQRHQIVTINPEFLVLADKDQEFKDLLNGAFLSVADGMGLVFAARFLFGTILTRVPGVELMLSLIHLSEEKKLRVFLLGGRPPEVISGVVKKLQERYPYLEIAGSSGTEKIEEETESQRQKILKKINNFKPHFLFVAYGAPRQEKWIAKNLKLLDVKVAMGVGGAFDYISGRKRRAPRVFRNLGLEWLWRLGREPRYRLKRVFNAVVVFPGLVLREKLQSQKLF